MPEPISESTSSESASSEAASAEAASLRRNAPRLMVFEGLRASLFPMAILTLFWKEELGLSMFQIMVVQGFFGLGMAFFELPSGYLADRLGYRKTLGVAAALAVLGSAVYCWADSLAWVLAAELTLGLAGSMVSGSDSALLYESLSAAGEEASYSRWAAIRQSIGQSAEGTAALVAGLLYVSWVRMPFVMQLGVWSLALWLAWRLVEPPRNRPRSHDHVANIRHMVQQVTVGNRPLRAVMATTVVLSVASFLPVWVVQIYAADAGAPRAWLGPIWSTACFSVVVGSILSGRLERSLGLRRLLLLAAGLVAIGYLGLGLTHAVWGFVFYWLITGMRGMFSPILHHQEQRLIPSSDRAGFLSLRSLVFRLTMLVIGPPVGALMDIYGARPVLLGVGAVLTVAAVACAFWCSRALAEAHLGSDHFVAR